MVMMLKGFLGSYVRLKGRLSFDMLIDSVSEGLKLSFAGGCRSITVMGRIRGGRRVRGQCHGGVRGLQGNVDKNRV